MTRTNATVFVVDDDESLRRALARLLEAERFAYELFASAPEFLNAYTPSRGGCLLLDVRIPAMSGLELQRELIERRVSIPIIFMTGHGTVTTAVQALKHGAVDFLEKPFDDQLLLDTVHQALRIDRDARDNKSAATEASRRVARLTARERAVAEKVVFGKTNREIASEWGISEKTVKVHRAQVMRKLEVDSVPELVVLAQTAGISTPKVVDP